MGTNETDETPQGASANKSIDPEVKNKISSYLRKQIGIIEKETCLEELNVEENQFEAIMNELVEGEPIKDIEELSIEQAENDKSKENEEPEPEPGEPEDKQVEQEVEEEESETLDEGTTCSSCGATIDRDVNHCPKCGNKIGNESVANTKYCGNCGKKIKDKAKYCGNCGERVS